MFRKRSDYPSFPIAVPFIIIFACLLGLLPACSSAIDTVVPRFSPEPSQSPTQSTRPFPTDTLPVPTVTANSITEVIPTTQAVLPSKSPAPLFTQTVHQVTANYVCPWVGVEASTPVYTYEVINTYPHDPTAYTQGLIYRDGDLYEGTGLYGQSSLRKVDLETGEVQQLIELPEQYFGEGITELDGKIFQLTWKEQTGFIYRRGLF